MAVLTFAFVEKKNAHFFFWLFSRPKTKSNGRSDGDQRSKNNPKTQNELLTSCVLASNFTSNTCNNIVFDKTIEYEALMTERHLAFR